MFCQWDVSQWDLAIYQLRSHGENMILSSFFWGGGVAYHFFLVLGFFFFVDISSCSPGGE